MEQKKHNVKYFFVKNFDKMIMIPLKIENIADAKDKIISRVGN